MARPGPAAGRLARPRAAPVLALAVLLGPATGWSAPDLAGGALPGFLLATAAGFAAAGRTSILAGGAVAMAVLVALDTAARAWPAWFPVRLASMPGDPRWPSSLAWTVGLSLAIVAAALALEARGGTRAGCGGSGARGRITRTVVP